MARLTDFSPTEREHHLQKIRDLPDFGPTPFVSGPPLRELAADGTVGTVSDFHYSFMGAAPIRGLETKARELTALLRKDRVDAVILTPV
jgi:hypothetical protein